MKLLLKGGLLLGFVLAGATGVLIAGKQLVGKLDSIREDAIAERDAIWEARLGDVQTAVKIAVTAAQNTVRAEMALEVQEADDRARRARAALQREKAINVELQEALATALPRDYVVELCGETALTICLNEGASNQPGQSPTLRD